MVLADPTFPFIVAWDLVNLPMGAPVAVALDTSGSGDSNVYWSDALSNTFKTTQP